MNSLTARTRIDNTAVSPELIRKIVLSLFRRRNDYGSGSISELLPELSKFGITTVKQFRLLMKKHRRALREEEEIKMLRAETVYLAKELDWEGLDIHANKSWFSILGLVRRAMELEFGMEASVYGVDSAD